jgi:integrase
MLGLMRHAGLRPGEVLSLRENDVLEVPLEVEDEIREDGDVVIRQVPIVRVVRRHNSQADTRKRRQFVKTEGRLIALPSPLHRALVRYSKVAPPVGRRGAATPLLFISTQGEGPLTKVALDKVVASMRKALWEGGRRLKGVPPHGLRHTFFEEQADALLAREGATQESVAHILRRMGGWDLNSNMPFHYAQNAYGRRGNQHLVAFNARRFADSGSPTSQGPSTPGVLTIIRNPVVQVVDDDPLPF